MKIVPISEKDQYTYIAIEDLGDGTCKLYESGDEALLEQFQSVLFLFNNEVNSK